MTGILGTSGFGDFALAAISTQSLSPNTSISSDESWSTTIAIKLSKLLSPSSIFDESWGTPKIKFTIYPGSITTNESWSTTIHRFTGMLLSPSSINSTESWGTPQKISFIIHPSSINSSQLVDPNTVIKFIIHPSSINSNQSFGTAKFSLDPEPTSIISNESWGTPKTKFTIYPSSINSTESWQTTTRIFYGNLLSPSSISDESWGTPKTKFTIYLSSINSTESWQTTTRIFYGNLLSLDSINTNESWGTPQLNFKIHPFSINTGEFWTLDIITFTVHPSSINSNESWGTNHIFYGNLLSSTSINSNESWGNPQTNPSISASSISDESWGMPHLYIGPAALPFTILSGESWGIPDVPLSIEAIINTLGQRVQITMQGIANGITAISQPIKNTITRYFEADIGFKFHTNKNIKKDGAVIIGIFRSVNDGEVFDSALRMNNIIAVISDLEPNKEHILSINTSSIGYLPSFFKIAFKNNTGAPFPNQKEKFAVWFTGKKSLGVT